MIDNYGLAEHIGLILVICGFVIVSLIALLLWIAKTNIIRINAGETDRKAIWEKIAEVQIEMVELDKKFVKDLSEIKNNYILRFDQIKDLMRENHEKTMNTLNELKLAIQGQQQFCKLIQENKTKEL